MNCKQCGCPYHEDHGCGTSIMVGSAYAEHILSGCSINPPQKGIGTWSGGFFKPNDGHKYPRWECPSSAGICPFCWHKENPNRDMTGFSELGKDARRKLLGVIT